MRLTVLALAFLPVAAQAQNTTITIPTEPVAQTQSCPVGMVWSDAASACTVASEHNSQMSGLGGKSGCGYSAAREITS